MQLRSNHDIHILSSQKQESDGMIEATDSYMVFTKKQKRLTLFFITLAALSVAGYVAFSSYEPTPLPARFVSAREHAAEISKEIVRLTDETNKKIKTANALELSGKHQDALEFVKDARAANSEAHAKAVDLASALQRFAESLADISVVKERRLAYEAVAVELSVVSEFIVYTEKLNSFFDVLSSTSGGIGVPDAHVLGQALNAVNEKVSQINELNQEFENKMSAFDAAR